MKNKFIELRVKGDSLGEISKKLNVPKTTLWRWDKEEEARINDLQLAEQDDFEQEWRHERRDRLASLQNSLGCLHGVLVDKIQERAANLPIKDLFLYINLVRSELDHYRIKPLARPTPAVEQTGTPPRSGDGPSPFPIPVSNNTGQPSPETAEQNGTIPFQTGTPPRSGDGPSPFPIPISNNTGQPSPETAEQNGTIPLQNGKPMGPPISDPACPPSTPAETASPPHAADQNGTPSPKFPC